MERGGAFVRPVFRRAFSLAHQKEKYTRLPVERRLVQRRLPLLVSFLRQLGALDKQFLRHLIKKMRTYI